MSEQLSVQALQEGWERGRDGKSERPVALEPSRIPGAPEGYRLAERVRIDMPNDDAEKYGLITFRLERIEPPKEVQLILPLDEDTQRIVDAPNLFSITSMADLAFSKFRVEVRKGASHE